MQMGFVERIGMSVFIVLLVASIFLYHWMLDRRQRRIRGDPSAPRDTDASPARDR